jgi:hypothetical protein
MKAVHSISNIFSSISENILLTYQKIFDSRKRDLTIRPIPVKERGKIINNSIQRWRSFS